MSHLLGSSSSPRPRRRWRKLLWALAILLVIGAVFISWAVYQSGRRLRDAMAEAARDDPHWQITDLNEHRASVPDSQNSALVIAEADRLVAGNKYTPKQQECEETVDELFRYPAARANDDQKQALVELLKPFEPAMTGYDKLKDMPRGKYPLKISDDVVSTLLPHTQNARQVVRALRFASLQRMEAGDMTGAADALIGGINAGRSIGDEPFLISGLVRIACDAVVVTALERFLAQTEADDANLARLQAAIELEIAEPVFLNCIRGERAFGFAYLEYLKENPAKGTSLRQVTAFPGGGSSVSVEEWLVYIPGMIARSQADILQHMNEAVRIAQGPYEEYQDRYTDWEKKTKDISNLARLLSPAVIKVSQAAMRNQAQLRCMQVAIAAERYRLQHKKWPEKLDDLVTAKLIAAVPLDPHDGKPLRWKAVDDGRIVYSVGQDRTDNGGNIDREQMYKDGGDLGFRLFDVEKRRQPPRPAKPKEPATGATLDKS